MIFRADFMRFLTIRGGESRAEPGSSLVPGSSRRSGGPVPVDAGTRTEAGRKPRALSPGVGVGRWLPTSATKGQDGRAGQQGMPARRSTVWTFDPTDEGGLREHRRPDT